MKELSFSNRLIYDLIEPSSHVLDLGCGTGELLAQLAENKNVIAQGIELDEESIYDCVEKGLSVFQSDIDTGLKGYGDKSVDYVILNESMQQTKKAGFVIDEALRVGKKVIIGIPNFALWQARCRLFFKGKVPISKSLPYKWYNTPNLHFLSLKDFLDFCKENSITVEKTLFFNKNRLVFVFANLFASNGIFLIKRG